MGDVPDAGLSGLLPSTQQIGTSLLSRCGVMGCDCSSFPPMGQKPFVKGDIYATGITLDEEGILWDLNPI